MLPKKFITTNPHGFTITAAAYREFMEKNDFSNKITHLLGTINDNDKKTITRASKHITAFIKKGLMSKEFVGEVFQAYTLLSGILQDAKVTLRTPTISTKPFQGEATLLLEIKTMWASLFSTESLLARKNSLEEGVAIEVQKVTKNNKEKLSAIYTEPSAPISASPTSTKLTATKIFAYLDHCELADDIAKRQVDGIYFAPQHLENLTQQIEKIAAPLSPRPLLYRASVEELKAIELRAIALSRKTLKNLWLLLPSVRTMPELLEIKKHIAAEGLYRSPSFKIWMDIAFPSQVVMLDTFIEAGIDGIAIDLQKLAMHMLGTDAITPQTILDPSILWAVEKVIKTAHKHHIPSLSLYQSALTQREILARLITWGVTNISTDQEAIDSTRRQIVEIERKLVNG